MKRRGAYQGPVVDNLDVVLGSSEQGVFALAPLYIEPVDRDLFVELGDVRYVVRSVRRGRDFLWAPTWDGSLVGAVVLIALAPISLLVERLGSRWKVGVIREGVGRFKRPRIVHKEVLPSGTHPLERQEELAEQARTGGFLPLK